jgi:glutamine synthetase
VSFVERHGLWTSEQKEAADRLRRVVEDERLETIRLSFPDQHGILRGKTLVATEALASLESGCTITTTMFAKDTAHRTVFPVFTSGGGFGMPEMEGAADVLMVADPTSFRVLPWAPSTGWLLCDVYFADGRPVPFATRHIFRSVLDKLGQRGFDFVAGLEVEFHIFKLEDAHMSPEDAGQPGRPPDVSLLSHGYQYLTEQRYDQMAPVLDIIRRDILALGLPLRSVEVEFGPSQCEFTFAPRKGLEPADNMILFRSAVKQIARRHGYHATFMCRPKLPNVFASGWHLHQSLVSRDSGENAFMAREGDAALSPFGRHYLAGLLAHARACAVFATPTINGYKRYRSYSLAPDRAIWGRDNRGVMVRVLRHRPCAHPAAARRHAVRDASPELTENPARGAGRAERRQLLPREVRCRVRRLLYPPQERGNRALPGRSVGLGAARIFRDVLSDPIGNGSALPLPLWEGDDPGLDELELPFLVVPITSVFSSPDYVRRADGRQKPIGPLCSLTQERASKMLDAIFSKSLIGPLEIAKWVFVVLFVASTIGVIVGVYWEGYKFAKDKQHKGWLLLLKSLAAETAFGVLIFLSDGWISEIQSHEIISLETKIEQLLTHRSLTAEQKSRISAALSSYPPGDFITVTIADDEAWTFVMEIAKTLTTAGWKWRSCAEGGLGALQPLDGRPASCASILDHIEIQSSPDQEKLASALADAIKEPSIIGMADIRLTPNPKLNNRLIIMVGSKR